MPRGSDEDIAAPWWRTDRIGRQLTWVLLGLGGTYLITVLVLFNQLIGSTYMDADAASAPVIGQLYGGSPAHRVVLLGQMAWYSTLMFELSTRWLPLHRQIWELAPYAMALVSVGLIGWGAWRVAGRWAAAVAGTLALCAAPHTLHLLFSLDDHSTTWFSLALLGAAIVALEHSGRRLGRGAVVAGVIVVGAIVGVNMASDTLLIGAGLAPFLLAAACGALLRPGATSRRGLWVAFALAAVAVVFDALTRALMHHENVTIPPGETHTGLASGEAVASNFKLWWQSIAVLGNGNFFGQSLGITSALEVVCAGLTLLALALGVRLAWRELRRAAGGGLDGDESHAGVVTGDNATGAGAGAGSPRRGANASDAGTARLAWCVFWGSSAVLLSIGFVVSSTPVDINSDRYLVGAIYATCALVPLLAAGDPLRRATIAAGGCVFAFTGLLALLQGQVTANTGNFPTGPVSGRVAQIARREHLRVG
ncbi:MAG TPA: hypothetical protein VEJ23_06695, partial [Solirubrobacteraceae bacterium]|nr:hypothetical protein [Solirubrobacteraceae bacterium]